MSAITQPIDQPIRLVDALLEMAEEALGRDDLERARDIYSKVLSAHPANVMARIALDEIERDNFKRRAPAQIGRDREVSLAIDTDLHSGKVPPTEAFILSRVAAGRIGVDQLLELCPMPEPVVLIVLHRFVNRGIVTLH